MSGFNVYPQPVATNRMVLRQNTAGQILLPPLQSSVTATTSSATETFGGWAQVIASTSVEYYITGVLAFTTADTAVGVYAPLYVDIGIGSAGGETSLSLVPIGTGIGRFGNTTARFASGGHALLDAPVRVAAGSRLAVRTALHNPGAASQTCVVYLIAVPYSAVEGN